MAFDISKFAATLSPDVSESDTSLREIPIDQVHPNTRNFYPSLPPEDLDALTESIEANGLLEPLTVVPGEKPDDYRLISGHNRLRALTALHKEYPDDPKWQKVPCVVLPSLNREQELSAIIEANRQRKKTASLLAEEAEKLTESYVARQKAGEKLPGRIRERVAEALRVSQTKLATVQAIKKNLKIPGFREAWETEKMPESVAYEISKLNIDGQYRLLDWSIYNHIKLTIQSVKRFSIMWGFCLHKCPHTGEFCANADQMVQEHYKGGQWNCVGCCERCRDRLNCPTACQYIGQPDELEPEPEAPDKPQPAEDPQQDDIPDWQRVRNAFVSRLRALREATGMSRAEFAEHIGEYKGTYSSWENGNLPGCDRMPKLAKVLGVSTDYLFGLSDERGGTDPATFWKPLDRDHWPKEGTLVVLRGKTNLEGWIYQAAHCIGSPDDQYPFEDALDHLDLDANDELLDFSSWMTLIEEDDDVEA